MLILIWGSACGSVAKDNMESKEVSETSALNVPEFSADSALFYLKHQCAFGPRVPNTDSHVKCGEWLTSELKRHGAEVYVQKADLNAFDGTILHASNIIGEYNPEISERLLLLAHWDSRPWADSDSDIGKHNIPVDGANDGASGVAVLLEIARQLGENNPGKGIDILFVDAEDWGTEGDDSSWALGARYFVQNPYKRGYSPRAVILLDMVGGKDACFHREYFSIDAAPNLVNAVWSAARNVGFANRFSDEIGGAVVDDHVEFIKAGIPAIDIIEYNSMSGTGFNPTWHTVDDTPENIDPETLRVVGQTLLYYIYR